MHLSTRRIRWLRKYPRVKRKREKGNQTPQPPKGAYAALESWADMPERQRRQENPVAKQCREPGGKGVPDFIVKLFCKLKYGM